jgi:hypothetical protein
VGGVPIFFCFHIWTTEVIPYNALNSDFANFETPCICNLHFNLCEIATLRRQEFKNYLVSFQDNNSNTSPSSSIFFGETKGQRKSFSTYQEFSSTFLHPPHPINNTDKKINCYFLSLLIDAFSRLNYFFLRNLFR